MPEKHLVTRWVCEHFNEAWSSECDVAFARQTVSCFIAVQDVALLGFACYDVTSRGFFGPTGVCEAAQRRGIGSALLFVSLEAMKDIGYAYAIIGGAGPTAFYERTLGATPIPDSTPGIYKGMLS